MCRAPHTLSLFHDFSANPLCILRWQCTIHCEKRTANNTRCKTQTPCKHRDYRRMTQNEAILSDARPTSFSCTHTRRMLPQTSIVIPARNHATPPFAAHSVGGIPNQLRQNVIIRESLKQVPSFCETKESKSQAKLAQEGKTHKKKFVEDSRVFVCVRARCNDYNI